jgi:hypothetical protein
VKTSNNQPFRVKPAARNAGVVSLLAGGSTLPGWRKCVPQSACHQAWSIVPGLQGPGPAKTVPPNLLSPVSLALGRSNSILNFAP